MTEHAATQARFTGALVRPLGRERLTKNLETASFLAVFSFGDVQQS